MPPIVLASIDTLGISIISIYIVGASRRGWRARVTIDIYTTRLALGRTAIVGVGGAVITLAVETGTAFLG